ncbi:hypothetical protein AGABI1DRAFT_94441 [Agaricus bisporus var. burnettii JB137-S8]|uniref:Uncharacterized protein n=1 Tax=Agaricus bisporus var. burnettii (strain JB137-S8 / ATCC MYA-4627 / FGSC 10392) TaxID=597362 RepID=K5XMY0_AGABU|nr:uncharacterized protein AGABI1DRAFT_94441 [Agaricus bisporus var. burnettii JB137-S8]EKM75975.1 hypothetical protein AGABI1DRAFT_94441 [Agaricus bisporus var. burnettii JB137-S8]
MSFLNLLGSGRKPPASARPAATTGKADTAPIHAHITNPSRKPSIDSLASTFRGRRQPSRALTDVASSHTEPPRAPTRSSTNVPEPRSSTDWRPRGGAVYESAHTSASSSLSSLADTIDSVHSSSSRENLPAESHSTSKTSDPLKKAPSPLEQEWSEVEDDSSDEDDFVKSSGEGSVVGTEDKGNNNPGSASLHEAAVLVEDEQKQAHRLNEELSVATQKLENLSKERDALQQRLQRLEFENSQQVSHLKATLEATDAVSGAAAQAHATAMEERQQEIKKLQRSLAVLELMVQMRDEEIKALSQENGTLHKDVANRDDVIRKHEESLRDSKKETDAAAVALWSYKARTALFADSLCTIERPSSSSSSPDTATTDLIDEESTSLLGPYLLSLVRSQSTIPLDTYDSYPLQAAIQATLVCCATRIMTAWYPGHWDLSDFLAATYTRIREAEGIPTSDTWKTTTRARLRPTTSTVLRVVDFLEECLNTLFKYAGWPTTGPSSSSSSSSSLSTTQTVDSLLKETREKLSALAKHCLRLNVLLDNVNPQLEPTLVEPGSIFDHHVMEREDVDIRSGRDDDREEVVATSEIGLRKVAEGSSGSGSSSSGRRRSVVKPKVILRSAFDA